MDSQLEVGLTACDFSVPQGCYRGLPASSTGGLWPGIIRPRWSRGPAPNVFIGRRSGGPPAGGHRARAASASAPSPDTMSTAARAPWCRPKPAGDGRRCANRSPGLSRSRAEHIEPWRSAAQRGSWAFRVQRIDLYLNPIRLNSRHTVTQWRVAQSKIRSNSAGSSTAVVTNSPTPADEKSHIRHATRESCSNVITPALRLRSCTEALNEERARVTGASRQETRPKVAPPSFRGDPVPGALMHP
jgi:hypothetical protein